MKKLLLLLFVYLSFTGIANAGSTVVNVDGVDIIFPSVSSLTEAQEELVGLLNQMQPDGSEIVIAYVTPKDFDRFENYEEPTFAQFVHVIHSPGGGDLSPAQFQKRINSDKKELKDIEKTLSNANELLVKQDAYLSSLSDVDLKNVVDAIIPFPAFIDTKNTFAATILAAKKQTIDGKTKKTGRLITTCVLYINNRILNIAFYLTVSENTDISLHEKNVEEWVNAFYIENNSSVDTDGESSKASLEKAISDAYDIGDYELAIKLILPLAQEGDAYSQYYVGYLYLISSPVYSVEESFKWSKKAAEQNYIPAYSHVGSNYLYGSGVLKDFKKAFYWFKKGAEAGDSNSQHNLAEMYVRGEGALKDYKKAYLWHSKAAEQNNIQSLIYAGEMACKGIGTQKNLVKSKYWMSKAYDEVTKFQLPTQKEIIKDFWEECDLANY